MANFLKGEPGRANFKNLKWTKKHHEWHAPMEALFKLRVDKCTQKLMKLHGTNNIILVTGFNCTTNRAYTAIDRY